MRKDIEVLKVWDAHKQLDDQNPWLHRVLVVCSAATGDPVIVARAGVNPETVASEMQIEALDTGRTGLVRVIRRYSQEWGWLSFRDDEEYDRDTETLARLLWFYGVVFYGDILEKDKNDV